MYITYDVGLAVFDLIIHYWTSDIWIVWMTPVTMAVLDCMIILKSVTQRAV
jgi:hypothetical protein